MEQQLPEVKKVADGDDSLVKKLAAVVGRAAAMFQSGGLKKDRGDNILVGPITLQFSKLQSRMIKDIL